MPITDLLERNAREFPFDVSLVEINPEAEEKARRTWKEYELIESNPHEIGRKEMTWKEFDDKANRFANLLLTRGVKKEDKIVFIGSSYNSFVDNSFVTKKIINELETRYELGEDFSNEYMEDFSKKFNIPNEYLEVKLIPYVIRDFALRWLCKSNLIKKFKIEIYGWGWDIYPETKQYFTSALLPTMISTIAA